MAPERTARLSASPPLFSNRFLDFFSRIHPSVPALVFHWEPNHPIGSRLHFVIHDVHHDHPNDRLRLVMPPAMSIPLAALFLWVYTLIFGTPAAYPIFSGFILGYLLYDYTHYHLHHHTPRTKLGKRLREQHMRHHFQDHRYGYGVSSPLWDVVFHTLPSSRRN